jgi:hypothetical protein
MKTGAVIFAYNNDQIDYVSMAAWNARNIRRHWGLPTSLVTDYPRVELASRYQEFDNVIQLERPVPGSRYFDDFQTSVDWYNGNRPSVFNVTPYDRTIVLDADYVVATGWLNAAIESTMDFWCYREAYDITVNKRLLGSETFGEHQYPMSWATVMIFTKNNKTQFLFDSMQMIRSNWQHYRDLYKIQRPTYRNDIALSIALGLVDSSFKSLMSLGRMASILPEDTIEQLHQDHYQIGYERGGKKHYFYLQGFDFHAMGKQQLGEIVAASF